MMVDTPDGAVNLKLDPQKNAERPRERLHETTVFRLDGETPLPLVNRLLFLAVQREI